MAEATGGTFDDAPRPVRRRRVYYVSGFDPKGPRRYHDLYRAEGARQAAIAGYELEVSPLSYEGPEAASWTARLREAGEDTLTEITMLRWDDIARTHMRRSLPSIYRLMALTLWRYVASGAFGALLRVRWISTWVGIYPVAMLIVYAACAAGLGVVAAGAVLRFGAPLWLGAPLGALVAYGALRMTRRWDDGPLVYYLMCDFGLTAAEAAGDAPEMAVRVDRLAERVRSDLAEDPYDEALIVGHSSGAAYAAAIAARVFESGDVERLSLLTLGQTIPMLSFLPGARALRDDLRALSGDARLDWFDLSSPADGACYALSDAAAVSCAAAPDKRNPKVLSAKFWAALKPETRKALRGRWFRIHIQYLCAFDDPTDYDYFHITAGPMRLGDRYARRRPSPKRIEAPLIQRRLRGV